MKKFLSFIGLIAVFLLGAVDPADYGAGEMKKPGRTFYVSAKGDNKNDGTSLQKAFRTIKYGAAFLRAGDTLWVEGGEYFENEVTLNVKDHSVGFSQQCGKPGSPIRIMGMPGQKVVLRGGNILKVKKPGQIQQFKYSKTIIYDTVQEYPSGIELQKVGHPQLVREVPGTYFYDPVKKQLLVHFAALEQKGVSVARSRLGMRIHGSYIHVENLHFTNYYEAVYMRMNMPYDKNRSTHNTIKNCYFYHNYKNGLVIDGSHFTLVTGNRGWGNTEKGSFMTMAKADNNLFIGNWGGNEEMTLRQRNRFDYNYSINNYGGNPRKTHVIGNVMDNKFSFRGKGAYDGGSVIKYNIMTGSFYAESKPVDLIVADNLIQGNLGWKGVGWSVTDKDFNGKPMKFSGNVRNRKDFKPANRIAFEAEKLKVDLPVIKFPVVTFKEIKVSHIAADGAILSWINPDCDGWGEVGIRPRGSKAAWKFFKSAFQGTRHVIGVFGLKKNTDHEYILKFTNRRGGTVSLSEKGTFKTLSVNRKPAVLEVGKGKLTLAEAGFAAIPGDTIRLLPGRHYGFIQPCRNGTKDKPITVTGKDAVIDGMDFYLPLICLEGKRHFVIDGLRFENPESSSRHGVIRLRSCRHVTIKNCRVNGTYGAGGCLITRGSSHIHIENNIFWRGGYVVALNGFHCRFIRNTVVDGSVYGMNISGGDYELRDNIFARSCIPAKTQNPPMMHWWPFKGKFVSDGNVFWSPYKQHIMGGIRQDSAGKCIKLCRTLKEWQEYSGLEKNTIVADPLFVDYKNGDFRLKDGSPAKGKGAYIK